MEPGFTEYQTEARVCCEVIYTALFMLLFLLPSWIMFHVESYRTSLYTTHTNLLSLSACSVFDAFAEQSVGITV